jgi:pimeloyl-ACP methyl ester carboxylesterase
VAEHLPHGRAVTLAGARHQPHLDAPAAVAHLMLDFLDQVGGRQPEANRAAAEDPR